MRKLFAGTRLRIETSDDVPGVVWSAILKNVYAIGLGMTEGLGWGANARGWFVAKAVEEAGGILEDLGGRRETFHGTAGVGDMVATGFSPHSKNRTLGEHWAKTGKAPHESEGQISLPQLLQTLGRRASKYPVLMALKATLIGRKKVKAVFAGLL
jgi:glycerol-3-phosphate dehydrogenase (NAD(P)+)